MLGVRVVVEKADLRGFGEIVALCRRGSSKQWISIQEVPLPIPRPDGAEWIEAYRRWRGG